MKTSSPDSSNPFELYSSTSSQELRKFSDELLEKFKGKILELYIGDQVETINYEDYSVPQNCIIYGKLIDVLDRFIVVSCYYFDRTTNAIKDDNVVYINAFQIRAMTELNGSGTLNDIFLSAKSSEKVKKFLQSKIK